MSKPSCVVQVAIVAKDLDRAIAFYRDVLGVKFLFRAEPAMAFFDCGGVRLLVGHESVGGTAGASVPIYYGVDDIHAGAKRLKEAGVEFIAEPRLIAKLADREVWLAEFKDSEGNPAALMSEPRLTANG